MKLSRLKYENIITTVIFSLFTFTLKAQIITTVVGNGKAGFSGDGGLAKSATLNLYCGCITCPADTIGAGLAVDKTGNLYISDVFNNRVRKVNTTNGLISTIAGNGLAGFSGDNSLATSASLNKPAALAFDSIGNLYISDEINNRIRKINLKTSIIKTIIGNGVYGCNGGNVITGISDTAAELNYPYGITIDFMGNCYIANEGCNADAILKVDFATGLLSTLGGVGSSFPNENGLVINSQFNAPTGVASDRIGNIYIADIGNHRIVKVNVKTRIINTIAGNGKSGYSGDGGIATLAKLNAPISIALDSNGNLFIADLLNNVVRRVDAKTRIIATVAGNGKVGYSGDGGSATSASLNSPWAVAVDTQDNLYIADVGNNVIRKVSNVNALPVTLSSFTATSNNKSIQTNWHTSTELNTANFIIQHSLNGSSFSDIATVKAIGSGANNYNFTDTHPTNGTNYYRLKSVDKDGASSYSKTVSAEIVDSRYEILVVPNPVKSFATIKGKHISSVQVIDNIGRVVKTVSLKDASNPTLSVGGLQAGVYHLRVQTTDGKVSGASLVVSY